MNDYKLATLSRGYKRKTKGFIKASENATTETIGDEPMQFYQKFKLITVAVDADRQNGISKLRTDGIEAILLDDAFQHRKVKAGLNIMLTTYSKPYFNDVVLPTGDLREPRNGASRADVIVVTKCPKQLSESEKQHFVNKIRPKAHQCVFFSWIEYGQLPFEITPLTKFSLVTGIANPQPLVKYLKSLSLNFEHLSFDDHHEFTKDELEMLKNKKLLLTTEKDYMRLKDHIHGQKIQYMPITLKIDSPDKFEKKVIDFMTSFKML